MSSTDNTTPNPWPPYDSYKDCSQGICSIYCPQWCYIIFPPPPPLNLEDDSGTDFSPLIIAVIAILASAFILVSYYTIISKYCRRGGRDDAGIQFNENHDQINNVAPQHGANTGLDEGLIESITVCKYKKGEGLVEGTDCPVCLSEFQEAESLRLLPKCNHAFHLPCIDTWLKSHSNCPLCRANIACTNILPSQETQNVDTTVSVNQFQHQLSSEAVLVIHDLEANVSLVHAPKTPPSIQGLRDVVERQNKIEVGFQPIKRSVSLNSSLSQGPVLVADILRTGEEKDDFQMQSMMKNRTAHVRSPFALQRSVSTGRFMTTRYVKSGTHIVPNV